MVMSHPFFGDTCAAIGRQLLLEPIVRTDQATMRLRKRWGDRDVVHVGVKSVVRTLRSLDALEGMPGRTESTRGVRLQVPKDLTPWMGHTLLIARSAKEIDSRELAASPEFFMLQIDTLPTNGYPFGDMFAEGGGRQVFRPRPSEAVLPRQAQLPGTRCT
jgi:hypothetical protein